MVSYWSVSVVSGNWYGIIGAYHNATTLHNSYGASGTVVVVNGDSIAVQRLICKSSLMNGNAAQGSLMANVGSIGRVSFMVEFLDHNPTT